MISNENVLKTGAVFFFFLFLFWQVLLLFMVALVFEQLNLFCLSVLLFIFLTAETGSLFRQLLSQSVLCCTTVHLK